MWHMPKFAILFACVVLVQAERSLRNERLLQTQLFTDPTLTASVVVDQAAGTAEFTVVGDTTGWVCLAFVDGPGGLGHSATTDSFVGWVANGQGVLIDGIGSNAKAIHEPDATNSYTLVSSTEEGGKTTLVVSRPLDTGDNQDVSFGDKQITVVWATGADDGTGTTYAYHNGYSKAQVNLLGTSGAVAVGDGGGGGSTAVNVPLFIGLGAAGGIFAIGGFLYQKRLSNAPLPMGNAPAPMGGGAPPPMGGPPPPMGGGGSWQANKDPTTGDTYYYNSNSGEVSWNKPPGM